MKRIVFFGLIAILFFSACSKDDNNNATTVSNLNSTLGSGSWRITYFWDRDQDETGNFSGYSFTFGNNNVLSATNTGSTITGSWLTGTDDSKVKLIINFISPPSFEEISEDWEVLERTSAKIRLRHISGGDGHIDYLTFEKN